MLVIHANHDNDPAPAGLHKARLTSINDLGEVESHYGAREMVELEFELAKQDAGSGQPYRAWRKCSKSLHPKSALRSMIEGLLGRPLDGDENRRFDVESLVGRDCLIQITHVVKEGRTYANVVAVLPALSEEEADEAA